MSTLHPDIVARIEEERTKCILRLSTQSTDKCRHRTFFELASCEARLGHVEEAITALREAMACGLDTVYVEELSTSPTFAALQFLPAFQELLATLEGCTDITLPYSFIYVKGEKERCASEALICLACDEPLRDPLLVHTGCGQMFCTSCITPLTQCPHCHLPITKDSLSTLFVRLILGKLDALKVHCNRCYKHFNRSELSAHIESCAVVCRGCKQKVAPAALKDHTQQCPVAEVNCSATDVNCPWKGLRRELHAHARSCTFVKQQPLLRRIQAMEEVNRSLLGRVADLERIAAAGKENS